MPLFYPQTKDTIVLKKPFSKSAQLLDEPSFMSNFWRLTGSAKALERAAEFSVKPIIKLTNDLR